MASEKQRAFVEEYLTCWNAAEAARRCGYSEKTARFIGANLLTKVNIKEAIEVRLNELKASADEVLVTLTKHMRGDLGDFFQIVEEWTFNPLPSQDIIGQKEVD